ncbi:MAG: hypothetical protein H7A46_26815, partial [Verrucomicrobiales bacterium]|nr:hypothetical protein [Verrucomicrobiales bacterium]
LEDKRRLKERLERIAGFRKPSRWSALAGVLLGALAVVGLTDPQATTPEDASADAANAEKTESQPDAGESRKTTLTARVLDPDDHPVVGGEVQLVAASGSRELGHVRTDDAGEFQIPAHRGVVRLLVEAPGWVPKGGRIDPDNAADPVVIRLEKGRTVSGRVVDADGKPVEGVWLQVADLPKADPTASMRGDWQARTDAAGRFQWESVPKEEVVLGVRMEKENPLGRQSYHPVAAGGDLELEIPIESDFLLTGRVLDAETGQPITHFEISPGQALGPPEEERVLWRGQWMRVSDAGGAFRAGPDQTLGWEVRFLATAEGYLPALSPVFSAYGSHQYEFRLTKGEGPHGIVVNLAGDPVSDAEVTLLDCGPVNLGRGDLTGSRPVSSGYAREEAYTRTDADGRFLLRAMRPDPTVIAIHRAYGFARITAAELATAGQIRLLPFGRIEGVVEIRGKPVEGQGVRVDFVDFGLEAGLFFLDRYVWWEPTDADGRFAFVGVPAGRWMIQLEMPSKVGPHCEASQRRWVTVKAGETTEASWRNDGRVVTGWVVAGRGLENLDLREVVCDLYEERDQTSSATDPIAIPYGYTVFCDENGQFRFEAVAAGRYRLHPRRMHRFEELFENPALEYDRIPVVIEPTAEGGTNEPLDVGVLTLR